MRFSSRFRGWAVAGAVLCLLIPAVRPQTGPALTLRVQDRQSAVISWPANAGTYGLEQTSSLGSNSWQAVTQAPARQGDRLVVTIAPGERARFYRLRGAAAASQPFSLSGVLPANGAREIGVTVHPQITFSRPVNVLTLHTNNFYATAAGLPLPANIVPAKDGSFAWLFFKTPMPGGTRVRVTVDGADILSANDSVALDADGDGTPGGLMNFEFTTVSQQPIQGTSLTGIVVDVGPDLIPRTEDDVQPGLDGRVGTSDDVYRLPIQGVRVFVLGQDQIQTTGRDGRFRFDAMPVGDVKVVIDGTTATAVSSDIYFPEMVLDAQMVLGQENWTMTSGSEVYLPRLSKSILQNIDSRTTNLVKATPEGAQGLSAFERNQLSIEVQPDSFVDANGRVMDRGQLGVSTVPPEVVRDMLPPGILQHTFDITVQAPGVTRLATPAPMSFPNVFNAPPGTKLNFLSFDHTTGRLVIDGTATVSEDGASVRTDPGTGITRPGWHGLAPPGGPNDPPCKGSGPHPVIVEPQPVIFGVKDYLLKDDATNVLLSFGNAAPKISSNPDPCSAENVAATPLVVEIQVDAAEAATFLDGLTPQVIYLYPGQKQDLQIKPKPLLTPDNLRAAQMNLLYGINVDVITSRLGDSARATNTFYIYRFFDALDDNHTDGRVDFEKTFDDGAEGAFQFKPFQIVAPLEAFPIVIGSGTEFGWDLKVNVVEFDPVTGPGEKHGAFSITSPGGRTVGEILMRGTALGKQRVLLSKSDLSLAIQSALPGAPPAFRAIFPPDSNRNGLYADEPGFAAIVDEAYAKLVQNIKDIFNGVEPPVAHALEIVDGTAGSGIRIHFDEARRLYAFSMPMRTNTVPGNYTGASVDVLGRQKVDFIALSELIDPGVRVAIRFETSADDLLWNVLGEVVLTKSADPFGPGNAKFASRQTFASPLQYVRATATQTGSGRAVFGVQVAPHDNRCNVNYDPACATWVDFDKNTFLNVMEPEVFKTSDGQDKYRFSRLVNQSYDDANPKSFSGVIVMFDNVIGERGVTNLNKFAVDMANVISHEVGHCLGAVHYRDLTHDYIAGNGDIMGNRDRTCCLRSFVTLAPVIKFALGFPVFPKEFDEVFSYYRVYEPLENYAHNSAPVAHNFEELGVNQPALSVFSAPLVMGQALPPKVTQLDFGRVAADGPGGQSRTLAVTLFNSGDRSLSIERVALQSGAQGISLDATTPLPVLVPPLHEEEIDPVQSSYVVTLRFDPATIATASDTLIVETDGLAGHRHIPITGAGVSPNGHASVTVAGNAGGSPVGSTVTAVGFGTVKNIGLQPLRITKIQAAAGTGEYKTAGPGPAASTANPVVLQPDQEVQFDLSFTPSSTGLRRGTVEILSDDPQQPVVRVAVIGTGLSADGDPLASLQYGNDFVALESPDFPAGPVLRAKTDSGGNFEFFLPPEQRYHGVIFDPVSGLVAHLNGITAPSGQNTQFGAPVFLPSTAPDTDGDGLPDDAEFAVGTNPNKADTDGNGVDDFTEIMQGRNPLGGASAVTGIIGRVPLPNTIHNLTIVAPEPRDPNLLHAYLAAGELIIVDVSQPSLPVVITTFRVPGTVVDVAVDNQLRLATVATLVNSAVGEIGVFLVNINNPSTPELVKSFGFQATEVESADGFAYLATPNPAQGVTLRSIDLVAQTEVAEVTLPTPTVRNMVREANFLYVLGNRTLHIVSIVAGKMTPRGTLEIPFGTGKMSVGDGIAYVPVSAENTTGGYTTIDVSDPDAPRVIRPVMTPAGVSAPSQVAAATGSGPLLLAGPVGGAVGSAVDVMDASSPTNTYQFVTRFPMPGLVLAVAPAAGHAFVGTHNQGLVVVNYLQLDTRAQAPQIRRVELLSDAETNPDGPQVIEGHEFHVRVGLFDDVQVHSVELLVNGQVWQRTASFPFNLSAIAPDLSAQASNIVIQVRATDTGGNATISDPLVARIIHDPIPPVLLQSDPAENERKGRGLREARLVFSKPMARSAAEIANFQLTRLNGPAVALTSSALADKDRIVQVSFGRLEPGEYQLLARASRIKDRAGNAWGASDLVRAFSVDQYSIRWTRTNAGSWFQPTNWVPARVPGPEDSVLLGLAGTNSPVYLGARPGFIAAGIREEVTVRLLESKQPFLLDRVRLRAEEYVRVDNVFSIYGFDCELVDTRLLAGTNTVLNGGGALTLERVVMEGDFLTWDRNFGIFPTWGAVELVIRDAVTLNGSFFAASETEVIPRAWLRIPYTAVLQGNGTIRHPVITVGAPRLVGDPEPNSEQITFGPGITLRGLQNLAVAGTETRWVNQGRIIFDEPIVPEQFGPRSVLTLSDIKVVTQTVPSGTVSFREPTTNELINLGTIEVRNGANLWLEGSHIGRFINQGILRSTDRGVLEMRAYMVSPIAYCDEGAIFDISGSLLTEPGQVTQLSGPGKWLAGISANLSFGVRFESGARTPVRLLGNAGQTSANSAPAPQAIVRMTNGAVLEGAVMFNDIAFEGELHNYDYSSRRTEFPSYLRGYPPLVVVQTNLTLNGAIVFHRKPGELSADLPFFGGGAHRLNGRGRIRFESAGLQNMFGGGGTHLTIGPEITVEANGVTFGDRNRLQSFPFPLVRNLGTILADAPGHGVRFNTVSFTNSGTIRVGSTVILTNERAFVQTAAGRLIVAAAGNQPGISQGQVHISGEATLDGALTLEPVVPLQLKTGDAFELVKYQVRTGTFGSHLAPEPPAGLDWFPEYGSTTLQLRLGAAANRLARAVHPDDPQGALRLNGTGAAAWVAHSDALNAYPMTLMAWVKIERIADQVERILSKEEKEAPAGYALAVADGHIRAWYLADSDRGVGRSSGLDGGFIADGQWHHVALVVDQEGGVLYVDGSAAAQEGWTGLARSDTGLGGATSSQSPLQFGGQGQGSQGVLGDLDEVILCEAALSGLEIQSWMTRRVAATEDERIIGLWHFDEKSGSTSADSSRHEHTVTLSEGATWILSDLPLNP